MARIPYGIPPKNVIPSIALVLLLGSLAAAQLAVDTIEEFEGYVPEGYYDPVGIPTKCFGDTTDVVIGREYSFDECARSLNAHLYELAAPVTRCVRNFHTLPDKTRAALISMTYNIGSTAMCRSSIVRYLNQGRVGRACRRMAEIYTSARGRKLPGLVRRRNYEAQLCLAGIKETEHE